MLNVTNNHYILSVIMLNVVMLSIVEPTIMQVCLSLAGIFRLV
jgi:hypothetical protein